jgi:hypothetical protein
LLTHVRWFSPDTPASSTTKTGRHDIVEILLQVALKLNKSINQSNSKHFVAHVLSMIWTFEQMLLRKTRTFVLVLICLDACYC